MMAAHPTRGVDIGFIEFIHDRLVALRETGLAVLLVSSKLEEIRALSDRVAVMYEGAFMHVVDPDDVTDEDLGLLMAGRHLGDERTADGDASDSESSDRSDDDAVSDGGVAS
jgi:simple sugar transport system ATP-binding protein